MIYFNADLVEMIQYATQNANLKFILVGIDGISKYSWAITLKSMSAMGVTNATVYSSFGM